MPVETSNNLYICPGETHPITRSVHLARLAAFFPNCRDCPFRSDTAQLSRQTVERLQSTQKRVERQSLLTTDGVRGSYLNELSRTKAEQYARAMASLLWQQTPLLGHLDGNKRRNQRSGPVVVVGHDERPSSPDIVTGVVSGLRRMGCSVTDISLCTEPCFRFTVDHLQAVAGIYVTGAGCEPSWSGLNFVSSGAIPVSCAGERTQNSLNEHESRQPLCDTLEQIEQRMRQPSGRPTRQAGPHRLFQAAIPYEAGLRKHFHALRPLQVAVASSSRLVHQSMEKVFENIPCRLQRVEIPDRARDPTDSTDADVVRLSQAVRERGAHLGMLVDHDGSRCGFVDEEGELVSPRSVTTLIAEFLLAEHPEAGIVIEGGAFAEMCETLENNAGRCIDGGNTQADMATAMSEQVALFGGGDSGRYWFGEAYPSSDAILTLARVLDVLSRSDTPFSEVSGNRASGAEADAETV